MSDPLLIIVLAFAGLCVLTLIGAITLLALSLAGDVAGRALEHRHARCAPDPVPADVIARSLQDTDEIPVDDIARQLAEIRALPEYQGRRA